VPLLILSLKEALNGVKTLLPQLYSIQIEMRLISVKKSYMSDRQLFLCIYFNTIQLTHTKGTVTAPVSSILF